MIPKKIHICWFSGEKYPVEIRRCIESWQHFLPDYEIRFWGEADARAIGCDYINQALDARRWAFASDAVRFYALYTEGGIYLDSDVMLHSRFDRYIPDRGFATVYEARAGQVLLQAAFLIGEAGNRYCHEVWQHYATHPYRLPDGTVDETISPVIMTRVAETMGLKVEDRLQLLDGDTVIYPGYVVNPSHHTKPHPEAVATHMIRGSWRGYRRSRGRKLELKLKHIAATVCYHITHIGKKNQLPPYRKMNVYISRNYRDHTSAGNKAKTDVETIMARMGFRNIGLRRTEIAFKGAHFTLNLTGILRAASRLKRGDVLFLQYPLKKYFKFITKAAHRRGAKVVVLIHDLGSYRRKAITQQEEIKRLQMADYLIATNPVMRDELQRLGLKNALGSLDAWDYLTATDPIPSRVSEGDKRIAYAGSLNRRKNSFLWEWGNVIDGYVVDIYGHGFRMDQVAAPEKFYNHGFVEAEKLIMGMTSDFGLVWDGDSLTKCEGDFGEYLALNTPHKMSLYLRARLPIIIWSGAAMAKFVTDNGIGFTVDTLEEINERLRNITPEELDRMQANVDRLAEQMAAGHYFTEAANAALNALSPNANA